VAGQEGDEDQPTAPCFHKFTSHHFLRRAVAALHDHIGLEGTDELLRGVLVEAHDRVHAPQAQAKHALRETLDTLEEACDTDLWPRWSRASLFMKTGRVRGPFSVLY